MTGLVTMWESQPQDIQSLVKQVIESVLRHLMKNTLPLGKYAAVFQAEVYAKLACVVQ